MVDAGLKFYQVNKARVEEGAERRKEWLKAYAADPSQTRPEVCEKVGVTQQTFDRWRKKYPDFASQVSLIDSKAGKKGTKKQERRYDGGFAAFRLEYFGHKTYWHQERMVGAYDSAKVGDIVLVLMPPEHGKTTTTEDDFNYRFALRPDYLVTNVSNGDRLARKMSRRVKRRMEDHGPAPKYVRDWGPFAPQTGEGRRLKSAQPWGEDFWDVYLKSDSDERDYSFATGGWRSNIAGARCHRLHLDDIQAKNSLGQTNEIMEIIQQDMLTRPGRMGFTSVAGTRVGERDVYRKMIDEWSGESFFKLIVLPALIVDHATGELAPLWPYDEESEERDENGRRIPGTGAGYTMEALADIRKRVGEEVWFRNYIQEPRSSGMTHFSDAGLARCCDPLRRVDQHRSDVGHGQDCWITLDPALGGRNTVMAMHPSMEKLSILDVQIDTGFQRNEQIIESVRQLLVRVRQRGYNPSVLIIEAMNFQKGLARDQRLIDLGYEYGIRIQEHLTGDNKYDADIGVPTMAGDVEAGKFSFPYGDDLSRHVTDLLIGECKAWKPKRDPETGQLSSTVARGNKLRQDMVMAMWFGWIWWQEFLPSMEDAGTQPINVGGLPWAPTRGGLLVPR